MNFLESAAFETIKDMFHYFMLYICYSVAAISVIYFFGDYISNITGGYISAVIGFILLAPIVGLPILLVFQLIAGFFLGIWFAIPVEIRGVILWSIYIGFTAFLLYLGQR
jgi:sorbitol-specific phosphotransferase system component IIBC